MCSSDLSPYREIRDEIRALTEEEGRAKFVEIYANAPLEALIERDVKGLYKKALAGEIKQFTGITDPYEPPQNPEVTAYTAEEPIETSLARILNYLTDKDLIE